MNGGPTVRRLHRARETDGRRLPYWVRRHLVGADPGRGVRRPLPVREPVVDDRPPDFVAAPSRRTLRPRVHPFPLSLAQLLDLGPDRHVLVLNGQVSGLVARRHSDSATVDVMGRRLYTQPDRPLDETLRSAMALHLPSLRQWVAAQAGGSETGRLDEIQGFAPAARLTQIDAFIHAQLIPTLVTLSPGAANDGDLPQPAAEIRLPQFESNFAFLGARWCSLVRFSGKAGNRLTLTVDGDTYLALEGQPLSLAVSRYDGLLEDAVRSSLADEVCDRNTDQLYRDTIYAVIRTPRGRTYVVQRVPPYVVEGIDKKLYYFDGVEIGIHVRALQARELFTQQCVQVLQDYRHMFVHGFGNYICMPRDQSYFRDLEAMPLAAAILHHLEAARMTLCAGYMPQNAIMHPVDGIGRRAVSLDEARRRQLPIYWYYKPRRPLAARVRALLD